MNVKRSNKAKAIAALVLTVAYCVARDLQCVHDISPFIDGDSDAYQQALQICSEREAQCLDEADHNWRESEAK